MMQQIKLLLFIEALLSVAIVIFYLCLARDWRHIVRPFYILIVFSTPIAGLFLLNKSTFYIYLMAIPLLSLGNSKYLASIYMLMLPQFPEIRENYSIGSIYLFDFSAIYAFNFGAFLAFIAIRDKPRPIASLDLAAWLLFLICLGFSSRGIEVTGVLRQVLQTFLNIIPPYYVLSRSLRTREAATEATLLFILGALCNGVIASFESVRGWPLYQSFYTQLNVPFPWLSATLSIRAGFLRAQGALGNPASLSLLMGFGILACLAMRERMTRTGRWLAIAALMLGMVASQSRGGWIAAGAGILLFWVYTRQLTRAFAFGAIALVAWTVIAYALPQTGKIGQLVGRSGDANLTAQYRRDLLMRGINEIRVHPISGQTRDELQVSMDDMRQGQQIIDFVNTHLFVALTLGIFGLGVWLTAWLIPLYVAWDSRRLKRAQKQLPLELPFAILAASFVCLSFTSPIDRTMPWVMMSIGLISAFLTFNRSTATKLTYRAAIAPGRLPQKSL